MSSNDSRIRPEKKAMVRDMRERLAGALYVVMADYQGMSMAETDELKSQLREQNAKCFVVRNLLAKRVIQDLKEDKAAADLIDGPTAMIAGDGNLVEVAKILKKFRKENKRPEVRGGILEETVLDVEEVKRLADLPTKDVLRGQLVGTLAAPMTNLAGVMQQKLSSLVYVLKAAEEKKQ